MTPKIAEDIVLTKRERYEKFMLEYPHYPDQLHGRLPDPEQPGQYQGPLFRVDDDLVLARIRVWYAGLAPIGIFWIKFEPNRGQ